MGRQSGLGEVSWMKIQMIITMMIDHDDPYDNHYDNDNNDDNDHDDDYDVNDYHAYQVTVVLPHSWGRAACQPGRRVVTR